MNGFRPYPLTAGGHCQTLLAYFRRRGMTWPLASEDLVVEAGPDARLLLRATWQPGPRRRRPALVLVHGLGGSDAAGYVLATGRLAFARGWHVVRMNLRGAGDGIGVCARLYNAGLTDDIHAALEAVAQQAARTAVAGFSLGGSLALLTLARCGAALAPGVVAAAAISPPLDLAACADALERPANRLYQFYFMRNLRAAYRALQRRRPDLYAADRELGLRTIREYDDRITAPYGGYGAAARYYAESSAGPALAGLTRPALVLAAQDDPLVPAESVARWPLAPAVRREILATGGHVGFLGATRAPGSFWAGERALDFLEAIAR